MEADAGVCKGLGEREKVCREVGLEIAKGKDRKIEENKKECDRGLGVQSGDAIDELVQEKGAVEGGATVVGSGTTKEISGATVHSGEKWE